MSKELDVRTVSNASELHDLVNSLSNLKEQTDEDGNKTGKEDEAVMQTSQSAAQEAIEIYRFREDMGSEDLLLVYPEWLTGESQWGETPQAIYAFGEVEYDGPDKDAVLFSSVREINDNVVQNNAWTRTDLSLSEVIDLIDLSDDDDGYVEDAGQTWLPRSYMVAVRVGDE